MAMTGPQSSTIVANGDQRCPLGFIFFTITAAPIVTLLYRQHVTNIQNYLYEKKSTFTVEFGRNVYFPILQIA